MALVVAFFPLLNSNVVFINSRVVARATLTEIGCRNYYVDVYL